MYEKKIPVIVSNFFLSWLDILKKKTGHWGCTYVRSNGLGAAAGVKFFFSLKFKKKIINFSFTSAEMDLAQQRVCPYICAPEVSALNFFLLVNFQKKIARISGCAYTANLSSVPWFFCFNFFFLKNQPAAAGMHLYRREREREERLRGSSKQ